VQFQAEYSGKMIHEDIPVGESYHFSFGLYCSFGNRFKPQRQMKRTE